MTAYRQEVKELAYKLDPECWVSYSGKLKAHKQHMDYRRAKSLREAERRLGPPVPEYVDVSLNLEESGLLAHMVMAALHEFKQSGSLASMLFDEHTCEGMLERMEWLHQKLCEANAKLREG